MARSAVQTDPPYLRIVTEIRRRIAAGELRAGERVPSSRQITQEWGVAIATATKVLTTLRQEGLVRAVPGIGTVVADAQPEAEPPTRSVRRRARDAEERLTRARIVHAAIAIADAEGLTALSMRRVAAALDVATMSLYRYVPGKEELVLVMADTIFGETELPTPGPSGWRARLEVAARLQWAAYGRHPWLPQVISLTRPQPLPNGMAHTEWSLRAVAGLGFDATTMLHMALTMFNYVRGTAVNLEPQVHAEQDTGVTDEQWIAAEAPALAEIMAAAPYPTLAGIAASDIALDLDSLFEFGLQRMLDGLATFIRHQPGSPEGDPG